MMARDYAAVPHEYLEEMEQLTDEEFGRLIRALLKYSRDGVAIAADGNEKFYVNRVTRREDYYRKNYDDLTEKRRRAGEIGAANRWKNKGDNGGAILPSANRDKNKKENKKENDPNPPRGNPRRRGNAPAVPGEMEECLRKDAQWLKEWSQQMQCQEENASNITMDNGVNSG